MSMPLVKLDRMVKDNLLLNLLLRVPPSVLNRKHGRCRKHHVVTLMRILVVDKLLESAMAYLKDRHRTTCLVPNVNKMKWDSLTKASTTHLGIHDGVMSSDKKRMLVRKS
jgi:hypothetical protein